ncbi:MAG: signal peptidase I, partial [Deltaproteobacteria bacterium]|nr:signal peptidase I [Deltaproteobacteria bacterium]
MIISYKLSSKSIGTLKKKGLSEKAVTELRSMEDVFFESPETFMKRVSRLESADEIMAREKQLLKVAKGYFRLDRWIRNKTLREWVEAIIFALVVATIVRTYLFAPFQIPSGSMIPTIQIGDHIFASMYSYGSPIPLTGSKLFEKPINRGDIVIFPYPRDPDIDYIKRV